MASAPVTFIGFGEAGQAFAAGLDAVRAYDRKLGAGPTRLPMLGAMRACNVGAAPDPDAAVLGVSPIVSVVTADQALAAATSVAAGLKRDALFCDFNSVAPDTKRAAAAVIAAAGGRYVDVAVMAPVHPQRRAVQLLASGPCAEDAAAALGALGFRVKIAGEKVGDASAVKMIRSVMVKGLEALSAECAVAARAAGVEAQVIASLDASWKEQPWADRFDYNLDRMLVHGARRAAEMEEVVKTLDMLGADATMTAATVRRQRALGAIGRGAPVGLAAKIDLVATRKAQPA